MSSPPKGERSRRYWTQRWRLDADSFESAWAHVVLSPRAFDIGTVALGVLWFVYGLHGSAAFNSETSTVSWWFGWELLAVVTVALAVAMGTSMPRARGFVGAAALIAVIVTGLLLGIVAGAGFPHEADERAFLTFTIGTAILVSVVWVIGLGITWALRRRTRRLASPTLTIVVSVLLAVAIVGFVSTATRTVSDAAPSTAIRSIQSTDPVGVSLAEPWWAADHHSYVPRVGHRTVALLVGYDARARDVVASRTDWVAHDPDGTRYEAIVWPNRRPLRKIGSPLPAGAVPVSHKDVEGWVAFVVPDDVGWLEVTFQQGMDEALLWRVDKDGVAPIS